MAILAKEVFIAVNNYSIRRYGEVKADNDLRVIRYGFTEEIGLGSVDPWGNFGGFGALGRQSGKISKVKFHGAASPAA